MRARRRAKQDGVVAIEFSFIAPLLVVILAGVIRIGGNMMEVYASERAASEVAQAAGFVAPDCYVSGCALPGTETERLAAMAGLQRIFEDVSWGAQEQDYRVIVQLFTRSGSTAVKGWEMNFGTLPDADTRVTGGTTLSDADIVDVIPGDGDSVIVVEVFRENFTFDLAAYLGGQHSSLYTIRWQLARDNAG
jgi:hypothetical protein